MKCYFATVAQQSNERLLMENPYWHEYYKPHAVDFDDVRDDCFQAFSIISASHSLMGRSSDEIGGKLHETFFRMAEERLARLFLSIAVQMRTFEDFLFAIDARGEYEAFLAKTLEDEQLGTIGNADVQERTNLTFREACNKIIHSEDFRPVYDNGSNPREEDFSWGMEGTIELKGRLGKKQWDAWLFADEFLGTCLEIAEFAETASNGQALETQDEPAS